MLFCIHEDNGYSNYTVEGTVLYCSKKLNPDMPFDRWYGEDARDTYAHQCPFFLRGEGPHLDVDGEEIVRGDDLEVKWQHYKTSQVSGKDIEERN